MPATRIVIEERLDGQEASVLAISDGQTIVTLLLVQDQKRAHDGDAGPNTGGMGATARRRSWTTPRCGGSKSMCSYRPCMP